MEKVVWNVFELETGKYLFSVRGGQKAPKKYAKIGYEVVREGARFYPVVENKVFK